MVKCSSGWPRQPAVLANKAGRMTGVVRPSGAPGTSVSLGVDCAVAFSGGGLTGALGQLDWGLYSFNRARRRLNRRAAEHLLDS